MALVKLQNLPIELLMLIFTKLNFKDFANLKIESASIKNKRIQECMNSPIFISHYKKTDDYLYEMTYLKNPVIVNFLYLIDPNLLISDNVWFRQVIKYNDFNTFENIKKVFNINYQDDTLCYLCSKYGRVKFLKIILHNKEDATSLDFLYLTQLAAKFNNLNIIKFLIKFKYFFINDFKINILFEATRNDSINVFIFFQDLYIQENTQIIKQIIQSLSYNSNRIAIHLLNKLKNCVFPLDKLLNIVVSNGNIEMLSILSKTPGFKYDKCVYLAVKKKNKMSIDYLQRNFSRSKGLIICSKLDNIVTI